MSEEGQKNPRISIVMPSWNGEKYIASTLDTIIAQSFKDWEAIVMDGGSKDRTVEILNDYAGRYPNIHVYSEPDEGPYHAIHKAAAKTRGEFIVEMCFSDGYLDPDWFAKCMEVMDRDPQVSLVWGIPFDMTEEGELLGPNYIYSRFLRKDVHAASRKTPIAGTILKKLNPLRPSTLFRFASKLRPETIRSAVRMMGHEKAPEKEAWFLYWLRTGTIFPDLNMFMSRKAFFDCMAPYHMGTRESGDWMKFYFNFNAKGFLSYCLPIPANFGRIHRGQVSQRVEKYNDEKQRSYFGDLKTLARETRRHPERFMFIDRKGKSIHSLEDYKRNHGK